MRDNRYKTPSWLLVDTTSLYWMCDRGGIPPCRIAHIRLYTSYTDNLHQAFLQKNQINIRLVYL